MNITEYGAKHGVSKQAALKWKKRGWLVFDGKSINVVESDKNLEKYRSDKTTKKDNRLSGKKTTESFQPEISRRSGLTKSELDLLLQEQKVEIAEYEKRQAKWNSDIREGLLLKADDVERINSTLCLGLRNKLLAIPSEYAIKLAICNDPVQTADILRGSIADALNDFLKEYGIID